MTFFWSILATSAGAANSNYLFPVECIKLVEVRAGFGIFRASLVTFFNLLEILVDVLPFLLASLGIPIVAHSLHSYRYFFPKRSLWPSLLVPVF